MTPDGTRLLVVQHDGSVTISELDSGTTVLRLPSPDGYTEPGVRRRAVTPDGLRFVVSSAHDLNLRDLSDGSVIASLPRFRDMNCFAVTADGRSVLAGSDDYRTRLWTPAESHEVTLPRGKWPRAPEPQTEIERLNRIDKHSVGPVRVDGGGRRALALYHGGAMEVWDLQSRRSEWVLHPHDEYVSEVFLTADGETAVTSSRDRTVKVWISRGMSWYARSKSMMARWSISSCTTERCCQSPMKTVRPSCGIWTRGEYQDALPQTVR